MTGTPSAMDQQEALDFAAYIRGTNVWDDTLFLQLNGMSFLVFVWEKNVSKLPFPS